MNAVRVVAMDLLRESLHRRWLQALAGAITLVLVLLAVGIHTETADDAVAATRFFGELLDRNNETVEEAIRPFFFAASFVAFYLGTFFGIFACADFGPSLLVPGRIEPLLALPLRRSELFLGTLLGVSVLALGAALYGSGGLVVVLGLKTGVWTVRPLAAGLCAAVTFVPIYAAMLSACLFVRAASASAVVGLALFVGGLVASAREEVATYFNPGLLRSAFEAATLPLPRIARIAELATRFSGGYGVDLGELAQLLGGTVVFGAAVAAIGIWRFESKDF